MNLHLSDGRLGGLATGPLPGQDSSVAFSRRKQINTLRIFNDNVTEVLPDSQYSVDFVAGGQQLSLRVFLGPGFPETTRPVLRVLPATLIHPWLEPGSGNVVGAPGLINYTVHSDLGRVVQAVKREFEKNPPKPLPNGSIAAPAEAAFASPMPAPSQHPFHQNHFRTHTMPPHVARQQHQHQPGQHSPGQQSRPAGATSVIPGLSEMKEEDLRELLNNDIGAREFCSRLDNASMKELSQSKDAIRDCIEATLEKNAELVEEAEALRRDLAAKASELEGLKRHTHELCGRVGTSNAGLASFGSVCERTAVSAREAEDESDQLAEEFLSNASGMTVEEFGRRYLSTRARHHALKVKVDKLKAGHTAGFAPF